MSKLRGGICDARCQQWHREVARKEEKLKTLWFIKNKQRLYDNLGSDNIAEKIKSLQQKKKIPDAKAPAKTVPKQALPSWRPAKGAEMDLMRPIKPEVRSILYVPKDESFVSRRNYLNERYKEKPEDRYYYPYCSSWEFGWRLRDHRANPVSVHGVCSVIQSSFYRRNASSLQRDPDWYRMCQTSDPKNFNEILTY